MSRKKYIGRGKDSASERKRGRNAPPSYSNPRADPSLAAIFRQIGVPEPGPFIPDPFQLEAIEKIKESDVLVSAPTGSGKTWIAMETIRSFLAQEKRVWYASPLKALSNSIYQQLTTEFGANACGILTGDRKENVDAPIIVGTTEILRNQLYDCMHQGSSIRTDLVILDEAHYLSDPERGVVWEEVLIYLPVRVRMMLLSATISNAEEVCNWLADIRRAPCTVVLGRERPVPLEMLFLFPDGLLVPLGGKKGLFSKVKKFVSNERPKRRGRQERIDFGKVMDCLRTFDLLPAIFFLKSRADCDRALETCPSNRHAGNQSGMNKELKAFLADHGYLGNHRQIPSLLKSRVASHHGGQLPYWKVLVENMMAKGFLDAIFSTSTVAAGVNFPARTVALLQSDRFNGREFVDMTATELHQMIGRAGRRGKDHIGFGMVIPGPFQDPGLVHTLRNSQPEAILSQIKINFSMTLNLLLSHRPLEVKKLVERSFAAFQESGSGSRLRSRWDRTVSEIQNILPAGRCDTRDPLEIMELIDIRQDLKKEKRKIKRSARRGKPSADVKEQLEPGRLFIHKNGNIYVAVKVFDDGGRTQCLAHNIQRQARGKKHRIRPRQIDLNQVQAILDYQVDLRGDPTPEALERLLGRISLEGVIQSQNQEVYEEPANDQTMATESAKVEERILSMPCEECAHLKICHGGEKTSLSAQLREFRFLAEMMDETGGMLWLNFKRHLRFLKETGFVDTSDHLTPDGYWATKLRVDQPLLIAEAIRGSGFSDMTPETIAAVLAAFVWDRESQTDVRIKGPFDLRELENRFNVMLDSIEWIRKRKKRRGFGDPAILFWPCAAVYLWAKGVPWDQLLRFISIDEGDMASLIMRTADHLRQIVSLMETHPELASAADAAIVLILREPVYIE